MVRGFYQLGSGMLTQTQVLNTIANNIANSKTVGYKEQITLGSTFEEMMLSRVDGEYTEIGETYMATVVDEHATLHTQGSFDTTGRSLDFAIVGEGFFAVEKDYGVAYTRNGSFDVDEEGYLVDVQGDRVLDINGNHIFLGTSDFTANEHGTLYIGDRVEQIGLFNFNDYNALTEVRDGYYQGGAAVAMDDYDIKWQTLENSNVDMAQEMVEAIASQRSFQYIAQAVNMYGDVLNRAASELGKM